MRILASFIIGFLLFFYSAGIIHRLNLKINKNGFTYSFFGLLLIVASFALWIISPSFASGLNVLGSYFLAGSGTGLIVHHLLFKKFIFSQKIETDFVTKHETKVERFLEIMPGALTWIALTSPVWLSFTLPYAVAYLLLIADVYWLLNALKLEF